ncbi:MAG TPA: AEC family transporter [Solirubrobacterales bacterium]|jgi:predicted permease|nr:AEC family transporter [Solirubrobacterales bacterium]
MVALLTAATIAGAVAVGVWAERRRPQAAARAARRSLTLMLYVLLPPVIFFNIAASHIDVGHGVGLLLGLVASSLGALIAYLVASRVLRLSNPRTGAVVCTVLSVNTGYLGYPLTVALLGRDQLPTAVLYDVLVTGPCLLLGAFAVGAALGTKAGETPRDRVRAFFTRNPPLYAAIAGILAPSALAPQLLVDLSQALLVAILPIGFFAVGATLAENAEHGELPMPPPLSRPVALALGSRLLLVPALLTLMAAPLIDLPAAYRLMAAMPSGINSMVVAHAYGLDMEITAEAVTWSTTIVVLAALVSLLV